MCIYKLNPTNVYNKGWNDQYLGLEKNPEEQHIKKPRFLKMYLVLDNKSLVT